MMKWPLVRTGAASLPGARTSSMVEDWCTIKRFVQAVQIVQVVQIVRFPSERLNGLNCSRLFLLALPKFEEPLLDFFLFCARAGIGVGKSVLLTEAAPLLRQDFAEGHVVAQ